MDWTDSKDLSDVGDMQYDDPRKGQHAVHVGGCETQVVGQGVWEYNHIKI